MGFSVSYLIARGKPFENLCAELQIFQTGKHASASPIEQTSGATLPNGDAFIWLNWGLNDHLLEARDFKRLTPPYELFYCFVHENSNSSAVESWKDGAKKWSVSHYELAADGLETQGVLPAEYQAILDEQRALQRKQRDVDHLFDVPTKLFEKFTGIDYDREIPGLGETGTVEVLEDKRPRPKVGCVGRLFGLR